MKTQPAAGTEREALVQGLGADRIGRFVDGGTPEEHAVWYYLHNLDVSTSLFEVISIAEVVMRNAMHRELTAEFGSKWYSVVDLFGNRTVKGFQQTWGYIKVKGAKTLASVDANRFVATMTFGSWCNLLDAGGFRGPEPFTAHCDYENTLWRPILHRAFPNGSGKRREAFAVANYVRWIRNRVAHHEPVIFGIPITGTQMRLTLDAAHDKVLGLVRIIDPSLEAWVRSSSRVPQLIADAQAYAIAHPTAIDSQLRLV